MTDELRCKICKRDADPDLKYFHEEGICKHCLLIFKEFEKYLIGVMFPAALSALKNFVGQYLSKEINRQL